MNRNIALAFVIGASNSITLNLVAVSGVAKPAATGACLEEVFAKMNDAAYPAIANATQLNNDALVECKTRMVDKILKQTVLAGIFASPITLACHALAISLLNSNLRSLN